MKLGQRTRDPLTGKPGYVVRFVGEYAICRHADGGTFKVLAEAPSKSPVAVRVNIFGVAGEYGGELVDKGRAVVINDGDPIWHGCKIQSRDASWERVVQARHGALFGLATQLAGARRVPGGRAKPPQLNSCRRDREEAFAA